MWGTDSYADQGPGYAADQPMLVEQIFEDGQCLLVPRAQKPKDMQKERTRKKAEVFTPSWMCERMTEHLHNDILHGSTYGTEAQLMMFQEHTWEEYLLTTILEITCGEAPFLVSRYDMTTGEPIPIEKRYGLLDRKLQRIPRDENHYSLRCEWDKANQIAWWFDWASRAFRTTYGYELQGDNLFLARQNMLFTFIEYFYERWESAPTESELDYIVNIVVWNIWQMNGLTGKTPPITRDGKTFEVECAIREPNTAQRILWKEVGKDTEKKEGA